MVKQTNPKETLTERILASAPGPVTAMRRLMQALDMENLLSESF
jgi:hypothetical protein